MTSRNGVGIVSPTPGSDESESGHIATRMIVNTVLCFHSNVSVLTRDTAVMSFDHKDVELYKFKKPYADSSLVPRLIGHAYYQVLYSLSILKQHKELGLIIFGGSGFILPMLTARMLNITVLYRLGGIVYYEQNEKDTLSTRLSNLLLKLLQHITCIISTNVILMSPSILNFAGLERYRGKSKVWNHYYFDLQKFSVRVPYLERDSVLGHVGIVSQTKGSFRFIKAIRTLSESISCQFLIVGDGPLLDSAKQYADEHEISGNFTGRVPRSEVPDYMNKMKLLVINSDSEGLPKVAFEAMACGTPVIATEVGGIPDYIEDGENGFLIDRNDPDVLSEKITEVMNESDLGEMSSNARDFVEENYSFRSTVEDYHKLCASMSGVNIQRPPNNPKEQIERP